MHYLRANKFLLTYAAIVNLPQKNRRLSWHKHIAGVYLGVAVSGFVITSQESGCFTHHLSNSSMTSIQQTAK